MLELTIIRRPDGQPKAATKAREADVIQLLMSDERSDWYWVRTQAGDLFLMCYPQDAMYEQLINGPDPIGI